MSQPEAPSAKQRQSLLPTVSQVKTDEKEQGWTGCNSLEQMLYHIKYFIKTMTGSKRGLTDPKKQGYYSTNYPTSFCNMEDCCFLNKFKMYDEFYFHFLWL